MVSVEEASKIIASHLNPLGSDEVPIVQATGRILAEDIVADRDLPPFDRVAMDGVAFSLNAFGPEVVLQLEGIQAAGAPRQQLRQKNGCIEVMTGAVLPSGADLVVRYEDVFIENGKARIRLKEVSGGMNIHARGADAKKGQLLLKPGLRITSAEVAIMASVGKVNVRVYSFPKAAILSTGDELVEIDATPLPHQIRRSNAYALQAAMHEIGWGSDSFHIGDNLPEIQERLRHVFEHYQVVILSGGVSKGKFDYIPTVLTEFGVRKHFHHISQRPGKPIWFGTTEDRKVVFALPGNPVSTFLCFHRYIKPWLMQCAGMVERIQQAILTEDVQFDPELTYFLQVRVCQENGLLTGTPIPGGGSGDFVNLKEVDGFLELPLNRSEFRAGEVFPFIPFR